MSKGSFKRLYEKFLDEATERALHAVGEGTPMSDVPLSGGRAYRIPGGLKYYIAKGGRSDDAPAVKEEP